MEIFNGWNKFVVLFYFNKIFFVIVFFYFFNIKNNCYCFWNLVGKIFVIEVLDFGVDIVLYKFFFMVNDGKVLVFKVILSIIV